MFDEDFDEDVEKKYVVLIIYDISDNKQRLKIAKLLSRYAIRVQKSAFEARLTKKQYAKLVESLNFQLMREDNVRIYRLQGYEEIRVFGSKNYICEEDVIII